MTDCMNFPKTITEFLHDYSFKDEKEVYTNGSELIQVFRVIQALEHYAPELLNIDKKFLVEETSNCEKCVHYYIDYYTRSMPSSCRSLKSSIDSLNTTNCPYFIERQKNSMLSEEEINSLDSFIKHFQD